MNHINFCLGGYSLLVVVEKPTMYQVGCLLIPLILFVQLQQETQLLLGDRATRKHAKDC